MATPSESCNYQIVDNYVVAIAVSGARSRRAVGWAAENLISHASRVLLLHVIPPLSFIPNPLIEENLPVENIDQDSSGTYNDERVNQVKKNLEPFKNLCETRGEVEIVVLVGEDPAVEILKYVSRSVIKNLVLGASTFTWFTRTVKGMDVPSTVLKSAPDICNIFLVSRWKLVFKLATKTFHFDSDPTTQIRKTKLKMFTQKERSFVFNEQITRIDAGSGRQASVISDFSRMNSGTSTEGEAELVRNLSQLSVIGENHQVKGFDNLHETWLDSRLYRSQSVDTDENSDRMSESSTSPPEVKRLRLKEELENTWRKYNYACKELIIAKKKIDTLTAERSEEAKKLSIAKERMRQVRMIAEEEKARHAAVIRDVEEAKQELANVTMDKHKAQIRILIESSKKAQILESLFSSDRTCKRYSEEDIMIATDNCSDSNKIGEGGYGNVYKCNLDHIPVAIKILNTDGKGNNEQFLREVEVLTRLNHPHMVLLLGASPEMQCLVYEYLAGGSLEDRLSCKDGSQPLPWEARFRIILEVACGLAFLHGSKPDPVIHCDIKPANILLDRNYSSKIGDVGLSRFMADVIPDSISEYKDTRLCGTLHYLDPEYQRTGTLRPKSDLYAFGITIFQVLTAKKPFGLQQAVEDAIQNGTFSEMLDPLVTDWPLEQSVKLAKLALQCASLKCKDRPDLESQVIPTLEQLVKPLCGRTQTGIKLNTPQISAPSYYFCPIFQEVMEDPYIAADGFTYERRAIQAWLAKHNVSPVTKLALDYTDAIPNRTLRECILDWKSLVKN